MSMLDDYARLCVTAAKAWKATPLPTSNSGGVTEIDITVTPGGACRPGTLNTRRLRRF